MARIGSESNCLSDFTLNGISYFLSNQHGYYTTFDKEGPAMPAVRGLFEVFVVDPQTEEVRLHSFIVAPCEDRARLKAITRGIREAEIVEMDEIDGLDIITRRLGDIRPKREVPEVRVAK